MCFSKAKPVFCLPLDLSDATFEELLKLRDKLGTNIYKRVVLNHLKDDKQYSSTVANGEDSILESKSSKKKRNDRSEPMEVSSKKLDYRFQFQKLQTPDELVRKKKAQMFRDPRFDSSCGEFKIGKYEQNYAFLAEMRAGELKMLKKRLKKATNQETIDKLRFLIQRLSNQTKSAEDRIKTNELKKKLRTQMQRLPDEDGSSEGRNTDLEDKKSRQFVNKTLLKKIKMVEKYKELKQNNRLSRYLEMKRKKLSIKDRSNINRLKNNFRIKNFD